MSQVLWGIGAFGVTTPFGDDLSSVAILVAVAAAAAVSTIGFVSVLVHVPGLRQPVS